MAFQKVMNLDDLWEGEMRGVCVDGKAVLLVRLEGTVLAYEDRCAHQAARLSRGKLDGCVLTCPAHEWKFNARTGTGINPAAFSLKPLRIRIENAHIFVEVPHE